MARRRRMNQPVPRRKRVWADTQSTDLGFAEDALRSDDLLADYRAETGSTQGVTVARTIVTMLWYINEAHTPDDFITVGLIKGTKATADVADPITEPYADWAFLRTMYSGETNGLVTADACEVLTIDTSAMRKVEEVGETWWLIYRGSAPITSTATYSIRARTRTLLLLPLSGDDRRYAAGKLHMRLHVQMGVGVT